MHINGYQLNAEGQCSKQQMPQFVVEMCPSSGNRVNPIYCPDDKRCDKGIV